MSLVRKFLLLAFFCGSLFCVSFARGSTVSRIPGGEYSLGQPFVVEDEKGRLFSLSNLKGKVVFINFWAKWCLPCLAEMPYLNKLHAQLQEREDLVFWLVDVDGNFGKAQRFMQRRKYGLPVHIAKTPIPEALFRGAVPTTLVINKYGKVAFVHEGLADYSSDDFQAFLMEVLRE